MPATTSLALLIVRIAVGSVLLIHGLKHLRNRDRVMRWTAGIGLRRPAFQWFFMAFAEIAVGLGLLAGILTALAAAGTVSLMTVAYWTVHRRAGFWITARPDEGWEYVFVLAAAATALAVIGPGEWSLDHVLGIGRNGWVGLALVGGGLVAAAGHLLAHYRAGDRNSS